MDSTSEEIFASCGVTLTGDRRVPELHTSAALFRFKLSERIATNGTLAQECGDYIDSLLSEYDTITQYLDPVSVGDSEDSNASEEQGGGLQRADSFVRLVLGVDALQSRVITTLLEKFPEFIGEEEVDSRKEAEGMTKVSVKILRQLRWLDYVIDSAGLVDKLLETLGYVPPEMQREIILALPDIISDADSVQVSRVLAEMMTSTPELMLPILETLGSLECSPYLLQEARNSVIMHLVSAEPLDLPVMIRFLLHSVSSDTAGPLIVRIRKRLDLDSIVLASRQLTGRSDDQTPDVLIFDVIATSLRSHKHLREAWLKTIASDTEQAGPHTTLDFAVLLILHQITTHTRRVESILRSKVEAGSSGAYTPRVIGSVIKRFPAVFSAHFGALLAVASWLVRTSAASSIGSQVGTAMVVAAFGTMGMFQRQEISGELAVHMGSGNMNEMDTAARTCLQLAHSYPHELRPFAIFIKGLLDYVDNLPIEHVRIIFDVLGIVSTLGGAESGSESSLFNDLYIFVRKQLASVFPKYNRVGIVGTVALLRQLGSKDSAKGAEDGSGGSSSRAAETQQGANIHALRRAVQLLEMLMDSGRHQSWAFVSMTYDELAHVVETKGLHIQLLTWLHENVSSTFASQFLGDPELLSDRYVLPRQPHLALSIDDDEPTVLDIFSHNLDASRLGLSQLVMRPNAASDSTGSDGTDGVRTSSSSSNKDSGPRLLRGCLLSCLPSLLRLIQVCEKALSEQSLAEIDSLLVCGMYLLPSVDIDATVAARNAGTQGGGPRYALAQRDGNIHSDTSFLISGDALVGVNEEARAELTGGIKMWPPELRRIICTSLYAAANWVREIINAFADQPSMEIRSKVVVRVNQLWHIESDLELVAASLDGTSMEFHPVAAGLLPEVSDSLAASWTAAPTCPALRIQGTDDAAQSRVGGDVSPGSTSFQHAQPSEQAADTYTVDVDGLLLSQDDTARFVEFGAGSGSVDAESVDGAKKRGRKRKSAGTGTVAVEGGGGFTSSISAGQIESFTKSPAPFLRELSFSAFRVLDFSAKHLLALSQERQGTPIIPKLTAHGLYVILRELSAALSAKLVRQGERRFPFQKQTAAMYGQLATFSSNISSSSSNDIVSSLLPLVPSLLQYLESCLIMRACFKNDVGISEEMKSGPERRLLAPVDSINDVEMVETCIDSLIQIVSSILSWDGLHGEREDLGVRSSTGRQPLGGSVYPVLGVFLGALAEQGKHTDANEVAHLSKSVLIRRAFDYVHGLVALVATSTRALNVLRMLISLRNLAQQDDLLAEYARCVDTAEEREGTMDGQISGLARQILFAQWSDVEFLKPRDLEYTVMQYFTRYNPHNRLGLVHRYATATLRRVVLVEGEEEGDSDGGEGERGISGTLRPTTFATYYGAVHQALAALIKEARFGEMNGQELLGFVGKISDSWLSLAKLTQELTGDTQRKILLHALNGGHVLVDLFIKLLVPQLDRYFLMHRNDVLLVFARVQKSTRILQNICNHSKVSKDMKLQSAVPRVKRSLEQLLFKVIAMMENNDCIGAINIGNLKHRDISGSVVSSQIPQLASEDDDEEMVDEDDELGRALNLGDEDEEEEEEDSVSVAQRTPSPLRRPPTGAGKRTKLAAARKSLLESRQKKK